MLHQGKQALPSCRSTVNVTSTLRIMLSLAVLLACLPAALQHAQHGATAERKFVVPAPQTSPPSETIPQFHAELITPDPMVASVHVASVCEGPDGKLLAAWYGGSHEGARDVNIYLSQRNSGATNGWSNPQVLVSRSSAMQELGRPVKKVGNAVLFNDSAGRLRLIYATISVGGWATSSLNMKTSRDGGKSWLPSQRLILSPFFNLSELVKNQPCPLSDGGWAIPIYHECLAKFPEILWMSETPAGNLRWEKTRIFGGRSALQPALVPLSGADAIALCRDCSPARKIQLVRSKDFGHHWSPAQPLALPNSDSGLDALRLSDGRILLAFNDTPAGRDNLRLAVSSDAGATWSTRATIEAEPGAEFSYPYLAQAKDGRIHLVYTWKRKSIKHAAFNLAWLDSQKPAEMAWSSSLPGDPDSRRRP